MTALRVVGGLACFAPAVYVAGRGLSAFLGLHADTVGWGFLGSFLLVPTCAGLVVLGAALLGAR